MRGAGLEPSSLVPLDPASLAAYVEVHIEQGPVLLDGGHPLGVVTSIASGGRFRVRVEGVAGHAGTVPMAGRRDALAAAAEMALALERRCGAVAGVVGTAGIFQVPDGTANVIPGVAEFTVDIRAPADAERRAAEDGVRGAFEAIATRRGVSVAMTRTHEVHAVPCADWLQEALAGSVGRVTGAEVPRLPSGAGHDAMILAEACDVGMLFVRCGAGGVGGVAPGTERWGGFAGPVPTS
jgi:hydantoinase/carbamoylase family amidase